MSQFHPLSIGIPTCDLSGGTYCPMLLCRRLETLGQRSLDKSLKDISCGNDYQGESQPKRYVRAIRPI
ncbi:hypothetical protein AGR1B_Cc80029 [Agrobacterium fabacearum S56]|nr:hypothetical protein AGR1B_Cc80029 [Agrobacterium fabacearum S56]